MNEDECPAIYLWKHKPVMAKYTLCVYLAIASYRVEVVAFKK